MSDYLSNCFPEVVIFMAKYISINLKESWTEIVHMEEAIRLLVLETMSLSLYHLYFKDLV